MTKCIGIMENHKIILELLEKYRPGHSFETVTNDRGVVELILPDDTTSISVPLDASTTWQGVKKILDVYESYIKKPKLPRKKPSQEPLVSDTEVVASAPL
jgi:hypothetical protein